MGIVIGGVSGSGKSTVGALVATKLGLTFVDGDDLHSAANLSKMRSGVPLSDLDRAPWLTSIGLELRLGRVVACSALRARYRSVLRASAPECSIFMLHLDEPAVLARMQNREGHFMPPALLDSQFATLELPRDEPRTYAVSAAGSVCAIATEITRILTLEP